jgi:hypothetical protein
MSANASVTLPATVEKIIKSFNPIEPEKAQIAIEGGDHLYREIRIENNLTDENGVQVQLKKGAHVEVTVEAPLDGTVKGNENTATNRQIFNQSRFDEVG